METKIIDEEMKHSLSDNYMFQRNKQLFSRGGIEDIQREIQETTKKIEHEKINSRICNERYEKQLLHYAELQGKPTPLTKEQKEKERQKKREKLKNRNLAESIPKKTTKDKEKQESNLKTLKELVKYETGFGTLTNDINSLSLANKDLRDQIIDLRKQKQTVIDQKNIALEINKDKERQLEDLRKINEIGENKIHNKKSELIKSVETGNQQVKAFEKSRDELEEDYHKIIEEFIKREREQKKEQARKRQILKMVSDSKASFKGNTAIEIEKQIKQMAAEEISDRTPQLEQLVSKWKYINKVKKYMIEKYSSNSSLVTEIFEKLKHYFEVDNYRDLPIVFKKTMDQMSNVDLYLGKLENENIEYKRQIKIYEQKIEYLKNKKDYETTQKTSFAEEKKNRINELSKKIEEIEEDIQKKRALFTKIQPPTDDYISKLNQTYLADYVSNKVQIDPYVKYSETNVEQFISNVEDYYKLIQMFEDSISDNTHESDTKELDKLRLEIKTKLEHYDKDKLLTNNFYVTMKSDTKNGLDYDEIIKKTSEIILNNVNSPITSPVVNKKKKLGLSPSKIG